MRVVIVNAFDRDNRGDAALLDVMIRQVAQAHPDAEILVSGFEDPAVRPDVWGVRNLGSLRRYTAVEDIARPRRVLRKLIVGGVVLAAALGLGRPVAALARVIGPKEVAGELGAIASADLVVSLGGGYLHGGKSVGHDLSVGFLLLPLWLAQRFGVPTVLGPQSYGPFPTRFQRAAIRRVLSRAYAVSTREDISRNMLLEAGVPERVLRRDVDSAFAFADGGKRDWRAELGIPGDARLLVMTMRNYLEPAAQEVYERHMAEAITRILKADEARYVVLAPQVTCEFQQDDDRLVNRRVAAGVQSPRLLTLEDAGIDHRGVFGLYGSAELTIATRFHSAIFSLSQCVPCVVLSYANKGLGIMRDLGFAEWVKDMATVDADWLTERVEAALTDTAYRDALRTVIPAYQAEVERFVEVLRGAARQSGSSAPAR
jgi:polysaccharide pyruvyl transferase WcaK-like protein